MADRPKTSYSYGEPNWNLIGRWLELDPSADGPFWAVNLMKYRTVADYGDDGGETISGQEADDAYAPLGPLAAIGAMVTFLGDVADQPAGEPVWDRIGIVRYPSRAAFFAMQQRDDFKQQHVHKEAGMEFTIVAACQPQPAHTPADASGTDAAGPMLLRVRRFVDPDAPRVADAAVSPVAVFDVEGVIVGDERSWHEVRFDRVPDLATATALGSVVEGVDEMVAVVLEPRIDRLVESIVTSPAPGG